MIGTTDDDVQRVAKAIADVIGHGMAEKCEPHARAALDCMPRVMPMTLEVSGCGVADELLTNIQRSCARGRNAIPVTKEHDSCLASFDHIGDLAQQAQRALSTAPSETDHRESLFYIQDTRQYVGNCPMWWCPNGKGYTTRLDLAGRYTRERAMAQHKARASDVPWPCEQIEALQRPTVDMQDMRRLTQIAATQREASHG